MTDPDTTGAVHARILELSNAHKANPSVEGLIAVAECLPELQDDPATFFELASALSRQVFYYGQYFPKALRDQLYYDRIGAAYVNAVRAWRQRLASTAGSVPKADPTSSVVWIISAQFLGPLHAPTKRVLVLAEQLKQDGFEPKIISANGLAYRITVNALDKTVGNKRGDRPGWTLFRHNGTYLPLWTPPTDDLGHEKFNELAEAFVGEPPRAVFHVGDLNVVADVAAGFAPSVSIPTTYRQPITTAHAMMERFPVGDWRPLADQAEPIRIAARLASPAEVDHPAVTRADLSIPEDARLIVLPGTRLELEVAPMFEQGLAMMLESMPRAWLLMCSWNRPYPFKSKLLRRFKDRIVRVHDRRDIRQIIACCDLMIDPPGLGGGGCARFAMEEGVPALAMEGGDAAAVLGPTHTVRSFNQLVKTGFGWLSGQVAPPAYRDFNDQPFLDSGSAIRIAEQAFQNGT